MDFIDERRPRQAELKLQEDPHDDAIDIIAITATTANSPSSAVLPFSPNNRPDYLG
jgi:hypothetical protein